MHTNGWVLAALVSALAGAAAASCAVTGSIGSDGAGSGGMTMSSTSTSTSVSAAAVPPFDKIDLLLEIDNTRSMAEKQQILGDALPYLLSALTDPPCLDADGGAVAQPEGPFAGCPTGTTRRLDRQ